MSGTWKGEMRVALPFAIRCSAAASSPWPKIGRVTGASGLLIGRAPARGRACKSVDAHIPARSSSDIPGFAVNTSPQNRHFVAAFLIRSLQAGQTLVLAYVADFVMIRAAIIAAMMTAASIRMPVMLFLLFRFGPKFS